MECINPDCTKADLLNKLFAGVEVGNELPEFCPFCSLRLRRRAIPKVETSTSEALKNPTVQGDEKRVEENRDKNKTSPVKDEKHPIKVTALGHCIIDDNQNKVTDNLMQPDATKSKHATDFEMKQQTAWQAVSSDTSDSHVPLQRASSDTSNIHDPLQRASSDTSNIHDPLQRTSSDTSNIHDPLQRASRNTHDSHDPLETASSDTFDSHDPLETASKDTSFSPDPLQRASTDIFDSHDPLETASKDTSNSHDPLETTSIDTSDSHNLLPRASRDTDDSHDPLQRVLTSTSHNQDAFFGQTDSNMKYSLGTVSDKTIVINEQPKETTQGMRKMDFQHSTNECSIIGQDYNLKGEEQTQVSYKTEAKTFLKINKTLVNNRDHPGVNRSNEGKNSNAVTNVTILGKSCVFGDRSESRLSIANSTGASKDFQSSSAGHQPLAHKQNLSQTKDQKFDYNDNINKSGPKGIAENTEKCIDPKTLNVEKVHTLSAKDQTIEDDSDTASTSDYSNEKDAESADQTEQNPGSVPYGKDVIKQKKNERKKKKKKKSGKNTKKDAKEDSRAQEEKRQLEVKERQKQNKISRNEEKKGSSFPTLEQKPERQQPIRQPDKHTTTPPPPSIDSFNEDCVTIIFHGLLCPDFRFKREEDVIAIRAGHPDLGSWNWNCIDVRPVSETAEKFVRVRGEMLLPVRLLWKPIPYKYVVCNTKESTVKWEYSEFADCYPDSIVNRSLALFKRYIKKGAIWHQYDGVIYPEPGKENSIWQNIKNWWTNEVSKNRKYAAKTFLPKWKGFITNKFQYEPDMLVNEAIEQMHMVSECLTDIYLSPGYNTKQVINDLGFREILVDFLKPKLEFNAKLNKKDLESSEVRLDRLLSSLAITHLICYYKLDLTYVQLRDVVHCLVLQASGSNSCDFDEIHKHFPEEMWSDLVRSILHLMRVANDKYHGRFCPDVVLAVPLLHFLRKDSKPFEEPDSQPGTAEEWYRTEGLPYYKPCDKLVKDLLPEALQMFTLDPLLCRLFLFLSPLQSFPTLSTNVALPVHEICMALFFKIRSEHFPSSKKFYMETLSGLSERLRTSRQREDALEPTRHLLCVESVMRLLQQLLKDVKAKDKLFLTGVQFALVALRSDDERNTMGNKRMGEIFYGVVDMVKEVVEKEFSSKMTRSMTYIKEELEVWTDLLKLNVCKKNLENWRDSLVCLVEKRLKTMNDKEVVNLFCQEDVEERFDQALVQSITQHAFDIAERIVETGGSDEFSFNALREKSLRSTGSSKAGELLSRMLTRAWSKAMAHKEVTDQEVLNFTLKWKPWKGFISFFGLAEKQKLLAEDGNKLIKRVIDCLFSTQVALADGTIAVRTLTLLNQYEDNFINLCCALSKMQVKQSEDCPNHYVEGIKMNLKNRNEELSHFQAIKSQVQDFINICCFRRNVSDFDIKELATKANSDCNGERLADLCKRVPSSNNLGEESIKVVFFNVLPNTLYSILPRLIDAYKSKIFQDIWNRKWNEVSKAKKRNQMSSGELTLLDVQDKVWQPSIRMWTELSQTVYDGSIHLKDVAMNFISRKIESDKDLKLELGTMFLTVNETNFNRDRIAKTRISQIRQYRGLQEYIHAAETVWKFKEALGLKGDFSIIEDLRNQETEEFKDKNLKSIDDRYATAGQHLKFMSLENSNCLNAVIECKPLVKWLRETIRDTNALSTLVDLAMISAGENNMEVDRISNFHTSCLNYAPLIFDVNQEFGFEDLMEACKPVWDAVKQDEKLSKKLAETNRHLEWLKAVQSSHGSVEMSSIMQVKAINSSGVFRVGQITHELSRNVPVSSGKKNLESVLSLTIPIDQRTRDSRKLRGEEREELKTYTLNDLKDLQSKLMLIAGKTAHLQNRDPIETTEEINRFVEVLEGMIRLGQVYIDLYEAGDIKYLEWSKAIHCSDDELATQWPVAEEIANTCVTMEKRLKKWRDHVLEKRRHYKELNHYTTKQILLMRRELGLIRENANEDDIPLQVYALLEIVFQDITSQDLRQVLFETLGYEIYVQRIAKSDSLIPSPAPHQGSFRSANLREKYQSFLLNVEKMGFDEDVTVAALKANDIINNQDVNETALITWCMDNGQDGETVSGWVEKARDDRDYVDFFPDLQQEGDTEPVRSFPENKSLSSGQVEATEEQLLNDFEQHPYLTLDELGSVLAKLSSKCVQLDRRRRFPDYLKREQPNLILVPKGDILPTVLTLYMQYGGDSLPTPNEVLICTHETTAEEVELFWWRAFEDKSQQIFCLVNPDLMDYIVSQTAVNMLDVLTRKFRGTIDGFRIIILCSMENEDRSHIIAALDEYRLNAAPSCASSDVLSDYLTKQFTCSTSLSGYFNETRMSWIPAAHLDKDSLAVRLISSDRAGVGKSLIVARLFELILKLPNNLEVTKINRDMCLTVTVPLHGTVANTGSLLDGLWHYPVRGDLPVSRIIHLDVSPSVIEGLDTLLFNLLVLGVLSDGSGRVWRRKSSDLYLVEMTTSMTKTFQSSGEWSPFSFVSLLPTINCVTPRKTLQILKTKQSTKSPLFDDQEYRSIPVQRVFQYLRACDLDQNLDIFYYKPGSGLVGTEAECLTMIMKYCGIRDPSWSELKHFVDFLNSQVQDCEESLYCKPENIDDSWMQGSLRGFKSFVIRFMVTMSRDFATPSLDDNAIMCSAGVSEDDDDEDIKPLQLRRRWESSPHPYIFFNQDRITMTFLGFHINSNGDLIEPDTKAVIQSALMSKQLKGGLELQRVDLKTNYSAWSKQERIDKLCSVMGVKEKFDPDTSYELTIDNMKKILAIHMRFRCAIPVVIMGETGCGKTRLIRFMCALQAGRRGHRNMLLMKVHGGTSYEDITKKVEQVENMAVENEKNSVDTVLFFDEANTTNALGMIKEVMVDRRINGRPVGVGLRRLHFIAACNPYRKHKEKMIRKLESAGLGYNVKSDHTKDKLGKIPLRHLVYRVHALPASMRPLVWDFGQLKPEIEELYIGQIVRRYILTDKSIPGNESLVKAICNVLAATQRHMRQQQDECSFVSLRDVERTMTVMTWFYQHRMQLRPQATCVKDEDSDESEINLTDEDDDEDEDETKMPMNEITWSLLLSLGVCYHAKLQDRTTFRETVISACTPPLDLNGDQKQMYREIVRCQKVVMNELTLGSNIARNTALSENVFMMVVCIELRIPLFIIGKPGSSKSLAKTVVADNMQGDASKSPLFKTFKRAHMVSYQCSPLSTPDGIVATFRQCRRLQDNNPDDRYASVVVLDEVGLAEDSPLMPLKTLHPLLEDGVTPSDDIIETDEKPTRVAFVGISNWALDPAKMNRGLMLVRSEPSEKELQDSARGICAERKDVQILLWTLLDQLSAGYADLYGQQKSFESLRKSKRDEFFGLRDFYSLVKMVFNIAAKKDGKPTWAELEHAIRRNFGGLDEIDAVDIFQKHVNYDEMQDAEPVDTMDLLKASLDHMNTAGESRYLLVLTENYSALRIVEQQLIKNKDDYVVIFGSSFPKDQEYTQVCRNINQIKVCMETGRTVVLLNLESLYESLYDALNQYYVYCADQKYVDLGLGSHRVKCRVDDSFRLIVIAEKDVVYKKFPIPLINRLEKHYLVTSKSLGKHQMELAKELKAWAQEFAKVHKQRHESQQEFDIGDAFVGYQSDTIPAMILQVCAEPDFCGDGASSDDWIPKAKEKCQELLIQCATPDAIARLTRTGLKHQENKIWNLYFTQQEHTSLPATLKQLLDQNERRQRGFLVQVSTHSRLLSEHDLKDVCHATRFKTSELKLLTLQQFQTEQQFLKQIRDFFLSLSGNEGMLLVQCDSGDANFSLIACTRHLLMDQRIKRDKVLKEMLKIEDVPPIHLVIIVQIPRVKGGCMNFVGFQGGHWDSFHVDDLRPPTNEIPPVHTLIDRPISELFKPSYSMGQQTKDQTQNEETAPLEPKVGDAQTDEADIDIMESNDDVMVKQALEQERLSTSHDRFDAMVLLRRSVQAAAGRLDDDPVMAKRATERIDLILSLLPEDSTKMTDKPSFARILHLKIYNLLLEKNEKQTGNYIARQWVRKEALSGTSIHERGTFRKALQQKVLAEVEPLLAKVFAFADRDCNLNLLRGQEPWLSRLWIFIFDNKHLSEVYYELSRAMIREHVQVSGRGKHAFRCCFPFSWLIKEKIDELRRGTPDVLSRSSEAEEDKLRRIMKNSELRGILAIITEEGKDDEAVRLYLRDFVHMVYQPNKKNDKEEIQLVISAVIAAAEKRCEGKGCLDFAAIHVAFNEIQLRLNNFNMLVRAEPDLTSLLMGSQKHHLTIDVAALMVCLEKLQPSLLDLESSEKRNMWCGRVLNIRNSIENMTSKEVFSKNCGKIGDYDKKEKELLRTCWMMWQRLSVVRLFIDHVCNMSQQPNVDDSQNALKLWKILGEDTDFMKALCIGRLEKFLLQCNQERRERNKCFGEINCVICLRQAMQPSVAPCGHLCCLVCASRWFSEKSCCPNCRKPVPADYTPKESERMREILNNDTTFRKQCDSFFMEVVSLFCFGYSPCGTLDEEAYNLLMDYVTASGSGKTKPFSPFRDQETDVNPVVRSFLLQQLLKSSDTKVKTYMDLFIRRARDIVKMDKASSVEVLAMCIQCMEDALNSKFNKRASGLALKEKLSVLERDFKAAAALLCGAREDEPLDVKWLEGIANTRFVLSKVAEFMYCSRNDAAEKNNRSHRDVCRALDRLIVEVKKICVETLITSPRLFLLKQLSRKFGVESINVVAKEYEWILPPGARQAKDVNQDRFLVYGVEYQRLRETISRAVVSGEMGSIQEVLKDITSSESVINVAVLLGVYQEVTANKQANIPDTIKQSLENFLQLSQHICIQSRVLVHDLLTEGKMSEMFMIAGETTWDRSIMEIIIHLAAVLFSRTGTDDLVGPIYSLALHPGTTTDSFLPTMPDDPLQDVRSSIIGSQMLYECPNGHPYLVTECGQPMEQARCKAKGCGAEIGGTNHHLTATNRLARATDLSQKGHCLGCPKERESEAVAEREMSAVATCVLRLLVHGSMMIGFCYHTQDLCQVILPPIHRTSVLGFLWKHAMCDMRLLAQVSGRSVDDIALMVHMVLQSLSTRAQTNQGHYDTLRTKDHRREWEKQFSTLIIAPIMENLESNIQKTMELIVNDKRFGTNPLLRQLYELESGKDDSNEIQPRCITLWRYRTPITLDHVTRKFNESRVAQGEGCIVLREFLKQEHKLRAIRFLPDVVKLQNLLMDCYHRTLDKTETAKLKWKDFEKRLSKGVIKEYKHLIVSFRAAWNVMAQTLEKQGILKKFLQNKVDGDSPVSMFIPATSGLGTCSLTLIKFLVDTHNEFIELYKRYSVNTTLQDVPVMEVTCSQLLSYDTDRDLLPLIHAHCHYSLEVGHGTSVEYDWTAIQRQLIDRLVREGALIEFEEGEYMKTAQVSAESVLSSLKSKIPQVELTVAIQNQIIQQYHSLQDICEGLSSLHIAITFLASGGGKAHMLISDYLHNVLKLPKESGLQNSKAQEACHIQHAVSLWRLLSIERAKILTKRGQDPFEHLSSDFKNKLQEKVELSLNDSLRKMKEEWLDQILSVVLEVIVLRLNDKIDINKEFSLNMYLERYLEEKDAEPLPGVESIPEEVCLKHIVRVWQIVLGMSEKYNER